MLQKLAPVAVIAALAISACGGASPTDTSTKLKVVATHSILGDAIANVAGDKIELTVLVPAGGDAHTFEPSPQDTAKITNAALLFENGLEFETWLDDMVTASGSQAARVVVSEGVEPRQIEEEHEGEEAEGEAHDHGKHDPHIWQSVANWIIATKNIRDALVNADPANARTYTANAEAYIAELQTLDTYIFEQVKTLPEARRKLITSHDSLGYFANRYGFEIVGTAIAAISTETADPSAQEIAALVDAIKAAGVPAVFAENVHNPKLMEQIAAEAGVALAPALYTDALGEPGSDGVTYLKMMKHNVDVIVSALSQ
jgi:zinc/manganese transport system substrate-binding protein